MLSLTVGYLHTDERDVKTNAIDSAIFSTSIPESRLRLTQKLSLTTSMQLSWRGGDTVNDTETGIDTSKTKLELGFGYGWSKRLTLNLNTRADISGNSGSEVNLTASYKFCQPKGALEKTQEKLKEKEEGAEEEKE